MPMRSGAAPAAISRSIARFIAGPPCRRSRSVRARQGLGVLQLETRVPHRQRVAAGLGHEELERLLGVLVALAHLRAAALAVGGSHAVDLLADRHHGLAAAAQVDLTAARFDHHHVRVVDDALESLTGLEDHRSLPSWTWLSAANRRPRGRTLGRPATPPEEFRRKRGLGASGTPAGA